MSFEQLREDDRTQAAILYRIIVIGEATKRISQAFRNQYSDVPWRDIAEMQDIVLHAYERVSLTIVWDVVQNKVPQLLEQLEPLLPPNWMK